MKGSRNACEVFSWLHLAQASLLARTILVPLFALFFTACANNAQVAALVGQPAPFATLTLLDGDRAVLQQFKGAPTVIVFWATTCPHSQPVLDGIKPLIASHPEARFVAVSLDKESDVGAVRDRIAATHLDGFTHVFSGNEGQDDLFRAFRGQAHPLVIALDARGVVRGAGDSADVARALLSPPMR